MSLATAPTTSRPAVAPRSRGATAAVVLVVLLVLALLASLALGSKPISLAEIQAGLSALISGDATSYADSVISSRVPRTVAGLMAGAALAVAGVLMQGLTRNPLADPGLLGVTAGASTGVVTALAFAGVGGASASMWWAVPGALLAMVAVFVLGSSAGQSPVRLILAGAVITALLTAYVTAISLSNPEVFGAYRFWLVGSLAGHTMEQVLQMLPLVAVGLLMGLPLGGRLNALALGEDLATALGVRTGPTKLFGFAAATLLCAGATAAVGPIGFIGLAVPHILRSLVGGDHRWLLGLSVLAGPTLLLAADVVGRVVLRPSEILTGVITALVGAPILIFAVRRSAVAGS